MAQWQSTFLVRTGSWVRFPLSAPSFFMTKETTNTLPDLQNRTFSVANESSARQNLLSSQSIDEMGVAHEVNSVTGTETMLTAISIDAQRTVTLLHFRPGEAGELILPVKLYQRLGFFVGHRSGMNIDAAFRMGSYPGIPLVTEGVNDSLQKEVFLHVGSVRSAEGKNFSETIDLFGRLGFHKDKTVGIFNRLHRTNSKTDKWQERPLVALPKEKLDLLKHPDLGRVEVNELQLLLYDVEKIVRELTSPRPPFRGSQNFRNPRLSWQLRVSRYTCSVPVKEKMEAGIGFGSAKEVILKTTGIKLKSLESAFRVVIDA